MRSKFVTHLVILLFAVISATPSFGVQRHKRSRKARKPVVVARTVKPSTLRAASGGTRKRKVAGRGRRGRRVPYSPWTEPTFADSSSGDRLAGEDPVVRAAAVSALGPLNGTVVAADPYTGRILAIVNQKLAFESGFQPCSTIKLVASLAGLSEGLVERDTPVRLYGRTSITMTEALAHSNNLYFANLGTKLGYDRVSYYAHLFGLGERAGLNITGEQPGVWPAVPPANGGVGMMTSFGEGIALTPLELASLVSAIANGGTLYYLQHPNNQQEIAGFVPRVKRHLDIGRWIPEIKPGMLGAVDHGTARRANYDPSQPIMGKTGTCTDGRQPGVYLGWFGSFNEIGGKKLVVVVLLTGGRPVNGPVASGVAGQVYKNLSDKNYWVKLGTISPVALISTQICCAAAQ
jgi:penicillin-binding protein 2